MSEKTGGAPRKSLHIFFGTVSQYEVGSLTVKGWGAIDALWVSHT